jgi:hypothetical protein
MDPVLSHNLFASSLRDIKEKALIEPTLSSGRSIGVTTMTISGIFQEVFLCAMGMSDVERI